MVHPLQIQHRELTEQLDELDEAIAELTAALATPATAEPEDPVAQQERLAWLHRQRAGAQVLLGETERALLTLNDPADCR